MPIPDCPSCRSSEVVEIVYGDPTPETVQRAERGEVAIGGCLVGPRMPVWHCNTCGREFDRLGGP